MDDICMFMFEDGFYFVLIYFLVALSALLFRKRLTVKQILLIIFLSILGIFLFISWFNDFQPC